VQAGNNVLGDVVAVDASSKQIFVKTDAGAVVVISVADSTKILKNPPGETKLDKATPYTLAEIAAGDRVLALGKLSDDGKTLASPRALVVNTKSEITAKQEAERAEWRRRGIVGVVSAVNPATKEITIQTRTPEGPKPVAIAADSASVKLTRYAPDSIKFADRKPSTIEEIKVGDQLRAKGDRSEDGARFTPEEVVTGTFRTEVGTVKSVDASKNEIVIETAEGKKTLTVVVRPDSVLKQFQLPPEALAMMSGGGGGQGGGQRVVVQSPGGQAAGQNGAGAQAAQGQGRPQGAGAQGQGQQQGGGGAGGGMRRMMGGDFVQQMLERMPSVALADLKPGMMVLVSSTAGTDPTRLTAIQLVSNVEPVLQMMAAMNARRSGGASAGTGPAPALGGAGGVSFGFGIGQP
jgi:hypothetical protein